MSNVEKEVEVQQGEQEAQDTEPEASPDVDKLQKLLEYEREQRVALESKIDYYKTEAKKAFDKRDRVKREAQTVLGDDQASYIEALKADLNKATDELNNFKSEIEKDRKLSAVKDFAKRAGLKDHYTGMIDKFVDLDAIVPDRDITLEIAVDHMKKQYPDLFAGAHSTSPTEAFAAPKLQAGYSIDHLKEEFNTELNKHPRVRDDARVYELKAKIEELQKAGYK